MSLRFIVSSNSSLMSEYITDEMKEKMLTNPMGKPIFYIVPEQMTFQQEYNLLADDRIGGSIRTQVVSFSRLAWRVLQETGGATKQFISATGTQMMLRKIIEQRQEPFQTFQKVADKFGFLQEIDSIITEFKRHQITPNLLLEQMDYASDYVTLQNKLGDLHYLYDHLMMNLQNKYIDGEDQLQLLVEKIKDTSFLEDAIIYFDGFHRFTPQELAIIAELMKYGRKVTITLTINEETITEPVDELDLFHQTKETYITLKNVAKEIRLPLEKTIYLEADNSTNPALHHLTTHFDTRPAVTYEGEVNEHIKIAEAVHPRAELEGVIQEILRLVREEDFRYRDIVIFARETEQYYDLIQTLFHDYRIPVFVDTKRTMLNHPFIELIRSIFDVVDSNWRYDALFRLLKTGFIPVSNEEYPLTLDAIDQLENYVLEYGIRSKRQWTQEDNWAYRRFIGFSEAKQTDVEIEMERKINAYRWQVVSALKQIDEDLRKVDTIASRSSKLYEWIERLEIAEQLESTRQSFEEQGNLERAREEEQVWQAVIGLFDEFVEMVGEEHATFSMFRKMFEAGLEALQFSHVPPSLDHVIVGSIDHSRIANKKCAFLIGVNEGVWPLKPATDGMINEREREFLEQFGVKLAASSRRVLLDDYFYMFLSFTLPTNFLWVSYVLSDHEGNAKIPSQMIQRLQQLYPALQKPLLLTDPDELQEASRFITIQEKTRGPLAVQLARLMRGYPMDDVWCSVLDWYMKNEEKTDTTHRILQSLFYENKPTSLKKQTVDKLVPKEVHASVSRMEMLYSCSYRHYLQYSLNLQERRTYSLEAPDIGQLFHEALKLIPEWVQKDKKDFAELTESDSVQYAKKSMNYLAPVLQHHILSSSNRYQYIMRKLQNVIAKATFILSEQARASGFSPVAMELGFGYRNGLQPITIPLPEGRELVLRGRIDRVDRALINDELFLRIIDYKSSKQSLSLENVYYGLALQMLTYLDVVLSQSYEWLGMEASPAGILYFHVHDPLLPLDEILKEEQIEKEIFKQYKMRGLIIADSDVAKKMDEQLSTGRSDMIPVGLKKDGSFYSNSHVAEKEAFHLLRKHVQSLMVEAGLQIITGNIELNPYEVDQHNACRFCQFKSVCQFDPILKENNYRRLAPLKNDDVMDKLQKKHGL